MNHPASNHPETPSAATAAPAAKFSLWQHLKGKRICYFALPLIVMATLTEFVILATGWSYQRLVCLPQGMGVLFLGIGPIGATILAVELLKLPLAIWTASRHGWQKAFMLTVGLPAMCLLTFQLVKDMAVYEMGVAMTPASELLEKASAEEIKIAQLNGELAAIEAKKVDRERKLAELAAKQAKAKADLEDALKHNETVRRDAITLTDYQKKELSEVESRQAAIIKQFEADTALLTKAIADLRAQREVEVARAAEWNAEEARIENAYKAKMTEYANKKAAYEKAKAEYDNANFLKRQLMREPVDPGVPPVREANRILKPAALADLDAQIKAKEAELASVNTKRRDRVAQVEADARRLRESFDQRSSTKREETDRKREELLAAHAALASTWAAEEKAINAEYQAAAQKVDGIRAEIDACRKRAEGYYEAREASIKKQQVHRIATTVEIIRGLVMGEKPVSVKATPKERGDLYTDQIAMVRIWVYPVLAFLVAFLPAFMVELGFSTIFKPERERPPHRLGFLGRRLHWLYTRAGRLKILRAERLAREATSQIAARDRALAAEKAAAAQALADKEAELQAAREAAARTAAEHEAQLKQREEEWVAKLAGMADSLNRAILEKDALRDLQRTEIERQVQMRQNAWADRFNQLRQELDDQRAAAEAERTSLLQEHHRKLLEVTEDCKAQVAQARRQMAAAELAAVDKVAQLQRDLKEAVNARDAAETQLRQQADALSRQLTQAREDAARELDKAARQAKHQLERQQMEFEQTLRQHDEEAEHRLKQREQELTLAFEARLAEEKAALEQTALAHEAELQRQIESRLTEAAARWKQEAQQRDEAAQTRLKQREQQLLAQAEARLGEAQARAEQELRRQKLEFEHRLETQAREAEARLREALQQKELAQHARLKQREQELTAQAAAREAERQNQWAAELRAREEDWQRQTESRVRAAEARLRQEAQQQEELFAGKLRQREQQLQTQAEARLAELRAQWEQELNTQKQEWERNADARVRAAEARAQAERQQQEELFQTRLRQQDEQTQARLAALRAELQSQTEQALRRREAELAETGLRALRELETKLRQEMQEREDAAQARARQREQDLNAQLAAEAAAHEAMQAQWERETQAQARKLEHLKRLLERAEKERDQAKEFAADGYRQVQELERKLTEASSLLTGWKDGAGNGKHLVAVRADGDSD